MANLLVAQSGGPTAAINATLVGILQGVQINGGVEKVYGARHGIEGVIKGEFVDFQKFLGDFQGMNALMHTPSSALGTSRFQMPDLGEDESVYEAVIAKFLEYDIRYFIYIGGNDSMDTVSKLSAYCKEKKIKIGIIGAPKTIDNDLCLTDHCPGFGSAAKYIATTISELAYDICSYDIPSVTIVEIMGRDAGWLTATAALARLNGGIGADLIYLCESVFDMDKFIGDIKDKMAQKPSILIAVSEGIKDKEGKYISEKIGTGEVDDFGHVQIVAGAARVLTELVKREIGCKVRAVEPNLMQRAAAHIASKTDIQESVFLGQKAYSVSLQGATGQMVAIQRIQDAPYKVSFIAVPVSAVANHVKQVPLDWISGSGNNVNPKMLTYLKPLIQGQVNVSYEDGIPKYQKIY